MRHVANGSKKRDEEKRQSHLIHRDCVLIYLAQTANYTTDDFNDQSFELIQQRLGHDELDDLEDCIQNKIKCEGAVYAW